MNIDLTKTNDFIRVLTAAIEGATDGAVYNDGLCVGLTRDEKGSSMLVPIVTGEQMDKGDMYVENAKVLYRVTVERI